MHFQNTKKQRVGLKLVYLSILMLQVIRFAVKAAPMLCYAMLATSQDEPSV